MHRPSIFIGKTVFGLLRKTGRTGSALPGLVVEKLDPNFLSHTLGQLPQGVFIISGTNGKTTTTKVVTKLLESQGLRVLSNPTGSNFVRGIISAVVDKVTKDGTLDYDIAIFEQDEAHAVHLAKRIKPRGVLVLNVMRDQMDRFGEIDTTVRLLQKLAASATGVVIINANDERVSTINVAETARKVWFGHGKDLQKEFLTDDQLYHAESSSFFVAAEPDVELISYDADSISISLKGTPHRYNYGLTGGHNALNVTAALALVSSIVRDLNHEMLAKAILTLEPAFGRGETITLDNGKELTIQLVKNPGGFTQALRMLHVKDFQTIGIAINDDYPDGRDVSWLWDVSFAAITSPVLCGGVRAADMANRLKYDDIATMNVHPDLVDFIAAMTQDVQETGGDAIIFCTYTAMLKIRALLLDTTSGLEGAEA
jgi:lipid II isoglutaminyl synthase (glutamine-hydrolysing)